MFYMVPLPCKCRGGYASKVGKVGTSTRAHARSFYPFDVAQDMVCRPELAQQAKSHKESQSYTRVRGASPPTVCTTSRCLVLERWIAREAPSRLPNRAKLMNQIGTCRTGVSFGLWRSRD